MNAVVTGRSGRTKERGARLAAVLGVDIRSLSQPDERRLARDVEAGLDRVEAVMRAEVAFADGLADATTRYLLDAGGKRIRPVLALLAAHLGDGATDEVIRAAAAIEVVHLASLYHDDVMDEAQLRRGVPSAQTVWGNSVAIITGDLLFARASRIVADLGERALRMQAETFERLCLGQLHETVGPRDGDDPIAHYLGVLADKTGSLIASAVEVGARFGHAPEEWIAPLREYGELVGIAFQLADDVIDLAPASSETGKRPGTDLRAGVTTLPLLYLRQDAERGGEPAALLERLERARAGDDDAEFAAAVAELRAHPVTERTLAEARARAAAAIAVLDAIPDGPVRRAFTEFARRAVDREA